MLCLCLVFAARAGANALEGHPSPYLAMHGQDPVQWRTWQRAALEQARREDKLLYLSVGYFSCHWCHVMHRESYLDAGIARLLNDGFVPVKIDRELEPALDHHLMEFMVATRGYGGWPLNVFLTPDGHPLYATTYLPADRFHALIEHIRERWRSERDALASAASQAAAFMQSRRSAPEPEPLDAATARGYERAFVRETARLADLENGGFGERSKFPSTPQLGLLLEIASERPDPALAEFLRLTLDRMAARGLRDHLGGGFFRYSTDPEWRVPHFEKMLYDNVLLAHLYLDAGELLGEPAYRRVALDTLDFLLREFWRNGAFIASLSAVDGDGVEGGYYLWRDNEVERILNADERAVATLAWGFDASHPLPAGRLPARGVCDRTIAEELNMAPERVARLRRSAHTRLADERARRRTLPRDAKRLAGWNGLALELLSKAAAVDGSPAYADAARELRDYLVHVLWDGERMMRAAGPGGPMGTASLQDYAYVARGLLAHAELSADVDDRALARGIVEAAWRRFRSARGWRPSQVALIPYGPSQTILPDAALPSPSATLIDAALAVAAHTDDAELRARATAALWAADDNVLAAPFSYATHIGILRSHPPEER